jgi:hypothetical protein
MNIISIYTHTTSVTIYGRERCSSHELFLSGNSDRQIMEEFPNQVLHMRTMNQRTKKKAHGELV